MYEDRHWSSESDVDKRPILTSKVGPRVDRFKQRHTLIVTNAVIVPLLSIVSSDIKCLFNFKVGDITITVLHYLHGCLIG